MHRRFASWLIALLACATASATPAPDTSVRHDGGAFVVQAEVELEADQRTAWLTVTDYERLPQFVPGIHAVKVLARVAGDGTERLLVEQAGELRFLWFTHPVHVWLDVTHEAPERVLARSVLPSGISREASTVRQFEASYLLRTVGARRTRLLYRARFEPARSLLPVLGTLLVRHTVDEQLGALAAEIERRAARRGSEQATR